VKKIPYHDMPDTPVAGLDKSGYVTSGALYRANNGVLVIYNDAQKTMYAVKGRKVRRRKFPSPVTKLWLSRRVNGFADDVKTNTRVDLVLQAKSA